MPRIRRKIELRDKFYILTNGKETEKNYFYLLKSKKSIYDIKVEYHNSSPDELVSIASSLINSANQVWCVFDIDNTYQENVLIPAINLANKTGVKIVFSNKAFEVWLLSHYKIVEKSMDNDELIKEMNKLYSKELRLNVEYDKTDKDKIKKYFISKVNDAITNSKIVYQRCRLKYNDNKIWLWNSCTNVFELVEALKLQNI